MTEHRCKLCTSNDLDALIEALAEDLWDSRRDSEMGDPRWEDAGMFWQNRFRELAARAVDNLRGV